MTPEEIAQIPHRVPEMYEAFRKLNSGYSTLLHSIDSFSLVHKTRVYLMDLFLRYYAPKQFRSDRETDGYLAMCIYSQLKNYETALKALDALH